MRLLLDAMAETNTEFEREESKAHADLISQEVAINRSFRPSEEQRQAFVALWQDANVRGCYDRHRHLYQIQDSAKVFFDDLNRLLAEDYAPTTEDLLRIRVCTTGVIEAPFKVLMRGHTLTFKLIDVGGQRSERRKWIHCFENVNAILFVAALSEYNQVLMEDGETNRMEESLKLFESIVNNAFFVETSFILFLNKKDLFTEKLKSFPLRYRHFFTN